MRPTLPLLLLLSAAPALPAGAEPPRYLDLVNQAAGSVVSLEAAAHGQPTYVPVLLDGALRGGGTSQTVTLRGNGCRQDLRFGFADGRVLRYEDVDVCRYGKLRIRALPRATEAREYVVRVGQPPVDAQLASEAATTGP